MFKFQLLLWLKNHPQLVTHTYCETEQFIPLSRFLPSAVYITYLCSTNGSIMSRWSLLWNGSIKAYLKITRLYNSAIWKVHGWGKKESQYTLKNRLDWCLSPPLEEDQSSNNREHDQFQSPTFLRVACFCPSYIRWKFLEVRNMCNYSAFSLPQSLT